jgi:hypothetical protein
MFFRKSVYLKSIHRVATADFWMHSIMMEKFAQAGEGFIIFTIMWYKVAVYATAEWAHPFSSLPVYGRMHSVAFMLNFVFI